MSVDVTRDDRRPPTMADIAKHLGVSRQLVSIALRDAPGASAETKRRVRDAARELGFTPHVGARAMRRAHSTDLGVIFAPAHATEPEIVEAIYPAAESAGYNVILSAHTSARPASRAVMDLLGYRCAALIITGSEPPDISVRDVARRSPVPVVQVSHGQRNPYFDVVRSSGDKGIGQVVEHLAALGHREIAYLHTASMPPAPLRLRGYQRSMGRLGLSEDVISMRGDYTEEAGSSAARLLLDRGELPTAVVASNDQAAIGLLEVLIRQGIRVPEDVSVTGFDDTRMARLSSIDLTTVRQDPGLMGRAAVEAATRRIRDPNLQPVAAIVDTSLVLRSTTASPQKHRSGERTTLREADA